MVEKSIEALDALKLKENEYSVFYKTYLSDFLSYWREGEEAPAENYVELLGKHGEFFTIAVHQDVEKLTDAMDEHGNTPDEQLGWLIGKLEEMAIIDRIHEAVVNASFQ